MLSWDRLSEIVIPSLLSAVATWLWASTRKVSKADLRDAVDRIEGDLEGLRLQLKEYATKQELQIQLSAIQQSLQDLRDLVKAALDKRQ